MNAVSEIHGTSARYAGAVPLSPEAEPIYMARLRERREEANRIFYWLLPSQWVFALILALFVSPRAWSGFSHTVHPHVWAALAGGALLAAGPLIFMRLRPGSTLTPHLVAVAQMLFSALFIHLTGGRIETHFHIFGSLAILAFYLERSVLLTAATVVVADHLLRGLAAPQSVFGVTAEGFWRSLEHGGWVLFEVFFLVYFTRCTVDRTLRLAAEAAAAQRALEDSEHRLRMVIDTAYDAYVAMDSNGLIVGWNEQAERTFGWSHAEAIGEVLSEKIIPVRFRDAHELGLRIFLQTGDGPVLSQRIELSAMHRDGHEFPIEITISVVRCGTTPLFNAFLRDITERKEAARQHEEINRQLVETSRQAGKAEVAVGVLHNVGNVLNSVNVAAGIINETIRGSKIKKLGEVVDLVRAQSATLSEFFTRDARAKLIPELLGKLTASLRAEHATLAAETSSLVSHVGHIRETVALQQSYATVSGVSERLTAHMLLEDALKLEGSAMVRHNIEVVRELREAPLVLVDRHKALQILVNLLRNAKQAMAENDEASRFLTLGISHRRGGPVQITVRDNGIGIAPENLNRIFGHGFTTKVRGHGFGLHISALAAREMGGNLTAQSDGPGKGAVFVLDLPVAPLEPSAAPLPAISAEPASSPARCPFLASTTP